MKKDFSRYSSGEKLKTARKLETARPDREAGKIAPFKRAQTDLKRLGQNQDDNRDSVLR